MYVIDSAGNECRNKDDLETACLQENQSRFDQAADTPFLNKPLFSLIGKLGEGPGTQAILNGEFDQPEIPDQMKELLQHLHKCTRPQEETFPQFTRESYREVWSKAKEITSSSSQYQLHFGHYMAACWDDDLTDFHATMADITLCSGYSPTRWRTGVNVMLPKKPGVLNVEQLRTILLYDVEFNGLLKWLG